MTKQPASRLSTHTVSNQPPIPRIDLYADDIVFQQVLNHSPAAGHLQQIQRFAGVCSAPDISHLADQANRNKPRLHAFDAYGHRINEIDYHPAYHRLLETGISHNVAAIAWQIETGGHSAHTALMYLMAQAEPGVCCPLSMTYAGVAALRRQPEIAAVWEPLLTAGHYDASVRPVLQKSGATLGMAMTEKQGGSDVRANTTRATAIHSSGAGELYILRGHKWFCSAPMSDGFLTLAQTTDGLSCFLVPRWRADETRNAMHIMRLKDKLGDWANASSEIEYHDAEAVLLGEPGKGVHTIIEMVQHTRLDCTIAPAAYMRKLLSLALWHCQHRQAFGQPLIKQAAMQQVLVDLSLETEAATALAFRVAKSFDLAADSEHEARLRRIITPVAKYWLNKRISGFAAEALECHGGAGFIEEFPMARYYRQAPLNGIWEGSGNIVCLDVLRALAQQPGCAEALLLELQHLTADNSDLLQPFAALKSALDDQQMDQHNIRYWVEHIALLLQAGLLQQTAPEAVVHAFIQTRLSASRAHAFGAGRVSVKNSQQILQRAWHQAD